MKKALLILALILITLNAAQAATIKGTIYDYSLQVTEAVITINTTPEQTFVAKDGTYEVIIAPGTYKLDVARTSAQGLRQADETTITITEEGMYNHDFILFEELDEIEEPNLEPIAEDNNTLVYVIIIFIGFALLIIGLFKLTKKKLEKAEKDTLEEELLAYIKEKKRTTQKELRKDFPVAEATISLALTTLEHKGHIEKIKKGRGNVINYKK